MDSKDIIAALDQEIANLQQVRALLTGHYSPAAAPKKPRKKRVLTPEGRARIAEAVKRRWAKQRRADKAAAKAA